MNLAASPSIPASTRSRNSTTVTSEPSRRQTEPSSSPITPAPTTISLFGAALRLKRAGRGNDRLLVDLHPREPRDIRTGGDDDRLGFERGLLAVLRLDGHASRRGDATLAAHPVDLVLLEQIGDAVDVGGDRVVLVLHHRAEIELGRRDDDAEGREAMRRLVEHFGGVEERLGRNAADVEAGSAERLHLLDHGDLHAELGRANGADVAAGAGADDNEIVHDEAILSQSATLQAAGWDSPDCTPVR